LRQTLAVRRLAQRLSLVPSLALLLVSGCSASMLAHASAEPTGCPEAQLEIVDAHQPMEGPSSWTAICRGPDGEPHEWFCSRAGEAQRVICSDIPEAK
jgi:hypothetical protein